MKRADALGGISEEAGLLVRRYGTPAMTEVNRLVGGWMEQAGMTVRRDNIGNLIGRYEGSGNGGDTPRTFLLGSHLDTVREAGKYDGPLGVLVAIACVQALHDEGRRLPFAVEVVAFADEEGLRFGTSYLGSRAYAGGFPSRYLDLAGDDGIALADCIRAFGGEPVAIDKDRCDTNGLLGYCEVHIEQGPVLEREDIPVGIVSGIAAQTRARITLEGESGHAGTVPMSMRRDALAAAAEVVLAAESMAQKEQGLVATVGRLTVHPGAGNVIPGRVTLSLDVRHAENRVRDEAYETLRARTQAICDRRGVSLEWEDMQDYDSVECSRELSGKLAEAVAAAGYPVRELVSGAGHDTVIMSGVCQVSMLFVRCKGGVSHNPAESVQVEDVAAAIEVMGRFLESIDAGV
jgi:allantoate deiminase